MLAAALLLTQVAACSTDPTVIVTDPPSALISVNGTSVGNSPVPYPFDFHKSPTNVVKATMTGYFDSQVTVNNNKSFVANQLVIKLDEDASYNATTTSEATNTWVRVQVDPSLDKDTVWQKLVDAVTSRYPSLEMIDNLSGYVRSVYISRKFKSKQGDNEIRTRFVGSLTSKEPLVYKLHIESDQRVGTDDWHPYSRVFREDAQLIEELQSRLGAK
jgi:hypothetical protein